MQESESLVRDADGLTKRTVEQLQEAVDNGDGPACAELSLNYYYGLNTERNFKRAFELCELGAERDDLLAVTFLGFFLQYGLGCSIDLKRAMQCYAKVMASTWNNGVRAFAYAQYASMTVVHDIVSVEVGGNNCAAFNDRIVAIKTDDPEYEKGCRAILKFSDPNLSPYFGLAFAEVLRRCGTPRKAAASFAQSLENQSFSKLNEYARRGDALAWARLAICYTHGIGVEPDIDMAHGALEQAAEMGLTFAQVKLGFFYEASGKFDEALRYYKLAADGGNADGICKAGMLEKRQGNIREALRLFNIGLENAHAPSIYALGMFYFESGADEAKAVEYWKRAAKLGFGIASEQLGDYFEKQLTKNSAPEKWREVFEYYRDAAESGVETSFVHCGRLFKEGLGVEQSDDIAEQYFQEVEERGDDDAREMLALYRMSQEETDYETRLRQFIQEDATGDALVELGRRYLYGEGVEKDSERAAWLFGQAAAKGNVVGFGNFGFCAVMGRGMPKNRTVGEYFLRRAAEMGDPGCQFQLGLKLEQNAKRPIEKDFATYWIYKAAEQRLADAASTLARRFWNGSHGVEQDKVMALYWWDVAEAEGLDEAAEERVRATASDVVAGMFLRERPKYRLPVAKLAAAMSRWMDEYAQLCAKRPARAAFIACYDMLCDSFEKHGVGLAAADGPVFVRLTDEASTSFDPMSDLMELYNLCEPLPSDSNLSCALADAEKELEEFRRAVSAYRERALTASESN